MVGDPLPEPHRTHLLRQEFLPLAIANTLQSLETAQALLADGYPSPAFVWAVRSTEILFREAILFPIYFQRRGDVRWAFKKAREEFRTGPSWKRAFEFAREQHGVGEDHDPPLTKDGRDAWKVWLEEGVGPRGEIVHGRSEADEGLAAAAIGFAERMREWVTLRLVVGDKGPFGGLMRELIDEFRAAYIAEQIDQDAPAHDDDDGRPHGVR
jgi:hypothetical protein